MLALEENWAARAAVFQTLKCGLDGSDEVEPYAAIAARLGMTEGAVKTAAYDLRKGFAAQVRRKSAPPWLRMKTWSRSCATSCS